MRGKVLAALMPTNALGITPAYAGKSFKEFVFVLQSEDHPRVCGEKEFGLLRTGGQPGSPPRMRGKG